MCVVLTKLMFCCFIDLLLYTFTVCTALFYVLGLQFAGHTKNDLNSLTL